MHFAECPPAASIKLVYLNKQTTMQAAQRDAPACLVRSRAEAQHRDVGGGSRGGVQDARLWILGRIGAIRGARRGGLGSGGPEAPGLLCGIARGLNGATESVVKMGYQKRSACLLTPAS